MNFRRVFSNEIFQKIPRYLFEQMENRDFEVQKVYDYAPYFLNSPYTYFYILENTQQEIKGILWASVEPIQEVIMLNALSVDKECRGGMIKKATDLLFQDTKLNKIWWINKEWESLQRKSWTDTNKKLMEVRCVCP